MGVFAISLLSGLGLHKEQEKDESMEELATKTSNICLLSTTLSEAAVMAFTIGFCLIPILIVVLINFYLVKKSHWHIQKIHDLQRSVEVNYNLDGSDAGSTGDNTRKQSQELALRQRKRAKMVAVLVCLFLVLVAPITIIDVIETLGNLSVPPYLSKTAVCLIYLNSALNVFVYAAFNSAFREAFNRIFVQFKRLIDHFTCLTS